jgi:hypothetical protein
MPARRQDDVDAVLAGGTMVIRNSSSSLIGRTAMFARADFIPVAPKSPSKSRSPTKSQQRNSSQSQPTASQSQSQSQSQLPPPKDHITMSYRASLMKSKLNMDKSGMIMIALASGGDYDEGVKALGIEMGIALASAGLGRKLINRTSDDLTEWRAEARAVLSSGIILGKRYTVAASNITEDWPDLDILRYYTHPIVSTNAPFPTWDAEIDIKRLVPYIQEHFRYSHSATMKLVTNRLWPTLLGKLSSI